MEAGKELDAVDSGVPVGAREASASDPEGQKTDRDNIHAGRSDIRRGLCLQTVGEAVQQGSDNLHDQHDERDKAGRFP